MEVAWTTWEMLLELSERFDAYAACAGDGGDGDGIKFNDPNDEITPDRALTVPVSALNPDGSNMTFLSNAPGGDVQFGMAWDDSEEYLGDLSGEVIFSCGYDGRRAFHFRSSEDNGTGAYLEAVTITSDQGISLNGHGTIKNIGAITNTDFDLASNAATQLAVVLAAGTNFNIKKSDLTTIIVKVDEATGEVFLNLPTSPGTSGSLWDNLGIVSVAP